MSYESDIECGEELAQDLADGLIAEDQLTDTGKRKLSLYRDVHFLGIKLPVDTPPED